MVIIQQQSGVNTTFFSVFYHSFLGQGGDTGLFENISNYNGLQVSDIASFAK